MTLFLSVGKVDPICEKCLIKLNSFCRILCGLSTPNLIEVRLEVRKYADRQTYFSSILSFHAVCTKNV